VATALSPDDEFAASDQPAAGPRRNEVPRAEQPAVDGILREAGRRADPDGVRRGLQYNALQLKVVDGQENPINIPVSAKFYEVQKFATMSNHMADGWVLAINPAKFAALPDAQKQALQAAAVEAEAWKFANDTADIDKSVEFLKSKGMQVNSLSPDQQKAFVKVSKELFPRFSSLVKDQAFFDKTLTFVGKK
jgi:TRAP-type transport system periplasmic protein